MVNNTHNLLSTPWLILDASADELTPALMNFVLRGKAPAAAEPQNITVFAEYDDEQESAGGYSETMQQETKYIPVLSIKSTIFKYDQACGPRGTQTMIAYLKSWEGNDNVMGVVLDIDSGGGQAAGTQELADYIAGYSKPIVAYSNGMICSAAYWIASACKGGIIVNKAADFVGSIGTMIRYINLDGIYTAQGAVIKDIYATASTRKNEEARQMANDKKDTLIITNILDPFNNDFHISVDTSRPGMDKEVYTAATYRPKQALKAGLIDKIGTMQDAFDKIISDSKKTKNDSKTKNMSNQKFALVNAALSLAAGTLVVNSEGTHLQPSQLETLENSLKASADALTAAQTAATDAAATAAAALATANADKDKATADLATAQKSLTDADAATGAQLDAMLTSSGLTVTGTTADKFTALAAHLAKVNKEDGATHTTVKPGAAAETEPVTEIDGYDVSGYFNS